MEDEEFLQKLMQVFLSEAEEHVQAISEGVLELEKGPAPARAHTIVETIFREAHSLKGAGRSVERTDIEAVCQALESVFALWKQKGANAEEETFDILNRAIDLVAKLLTQPAASASPGDQKTLQETIQTVTQLVETGERKPETGDFKTGDRRPETGKIGAHGEERAGEPARILPSKARARESESAQAVPSFPVSGLRSPVSEQSPEGREHEADKPQAAPSFPVSGLRSPVSEQSPEGREHEDEKPQLDPFSPVSAFRSPVSEVVRVPVGKMDALLLQAEEMLTVKISSTQRAVELRELGVTVAVWRKKWAKTREAMESSGVSPRELLDWNESQIDALGKRLGMCAKAATHDERSAGMMIDALLEDAKRLVMLPFARLLRLFPKLVRDLSHQERKDVDLSIRGGEIEIDKRILEEMKAPLIHLARNAVDHGLETPEARVRHGKPPRGALSISMSQIDANKVEMVVADDGTGIDSARVRAAAVKSGILSQADADQLSESAALALIFQSGVSTSPILTEISGRGLGMAIVREKVDWLGGQIAIETAPNAGTSFRIVLPMTLATFQAVLVSVGGQTFAVPPAGIVRIMRVKRSELKTVETLQTISFEGGALSLAWMADVLELPRRETKEPPPYVEVLVLRAAEQRIGFVVESVISEQEVLVKKLGKPLVRVRNISGATVLASGAPVLILNISDLVKSAAAAGSGPARIGPAAGAAKPTVVRHILVADDSVTSRMLLKHILEFGGYHVTTAVDGLDALMILRTGDFDCVVSDVEMPRMDGFEFTTKIRAEKRFADLPVVLVTALGSRESRERGIDAGANAYIVKSAFDQNNLLKIIAKLV